MEQPAHLQFLANEVLALLGRLQTVRSFSLNAPMVRAAAVSGAAHAAINDHLARVALDLRGRLRACLRWLQSPAGAAAPAHEAQGRYVLLKLRYNNLLDQLDIFADVLLQRAEHATGVWMAGLDVLAADALALPGGYYEAPPLVCFLQRGHGAAIRRARTRLPGGDSNPVAVIQIPRERMIGSGIASSLVHEVGHQGSELLGLTASVKKVLDARAAQAADGEAVAWGLLGRWLNEILSDFWAVAHLGISATYGLMSVVSLPSYFVFRIASDGPHPFPWIRVKISLAAGQALFPHPQWAALGRQWEQLYPLAELPPDKQALIGQLEALLPRFAQLLAEHRPPGLRGQALREVFPVAARQPERLRQLYPHWQANPALWEQSPPTLAFAVVGQAKADGRLSGGEEVRLLRRLLTRWALNRAKRADAASAARAPRPALSVSPLTV